MAEYNESQINSNETERISAEQERINNEAQRQTKETEREARETTRQSNESTRISEYNTFMANVHNAEDERIANEEERVQAEASRVSAEEGRVKAENIRAEFYDGFNDRLDEVDSQLAHNANDINNIKHLDIRQFPRLQNETDDTERFKRALKEIGNYGVLNISGTLKLSGVITLPENSKINGEFKTSTIIEFDNGGFDVGGSYVEIHNCTIDGKGTSEIGIKSLNYRNWLTVNECYIKNFTTWGIYVEGGIAGRLQNLDTIGCGVEGNENSGSIYVRSTSASDAYAVEWNIRNIYMHTGGGVGLYLNKCVDFNIEGIIVEYHDIAFKFKVAVVTCYNLYEEANRGEHDTVCIDSSPSFINCTRLNPHYIWDGVAFDQRKALEISGGNINANNVEVSTLSFNSLPNPKKEENSVTINEKNHFVIYKGDKFVRVDNAIEKLFDGDSIVSVDLGNVNTPSSFILKITSVNETGASDRFMYREIFVTSAYYTDSYHTQVLQSYGSFLKQEPSFSLDNNKNLILTFRTSSGSNYTCIKLENLYGNYRIPKFV